MGENQMGETPGFVCQLQPDRWHTWLLSERVPAANTSLKPVGLGVWLISL